MTQWGDAPRIQGPPNTQDLSVVMEYVKDLANTVAKMAKDVEFILNGNVAFDNIRTNGIVAKNIQAEAITTEKIQAGAVTADKITVNELSAISANLGHIVAGLIESVQIFGSYIATSYGSYPLVELSNTDNMLGAYKSPNNSLQVFSPSDKFSPVVKFSAAGVDSFIFYDPSDNTFSFTSSDADINISTLREIQLYASGVRLAGWTILTNNRTGRSLQQDLDDKATSGTYTGSAGPYNCGIPIGTVLQDVNGDPYTWQGVPAHYHIQN